MITELTAALLTHGLANRTTGFSMIVLIGGKPRLALHARELVHDEAELPARLLARRHELSCGAAIRVGERVDGAGGGDSCSGIMRRSARPGRSHARPRVRGCVTERLTLQRRTRPARHVGVDREPAFIE